MIRLCLWCAGREIETYMDKTYKTTGIVLKRRDYQENDRLFVIYTRDFGKLELLAKGTKKIQSKLNSHLEPFYQVNLMAAKGRGFDKLAGSNLLSSYDKLRSDNLGFATGCYIIELTDKLLGQGLPDQTIFNLLEQVLIQLDGLVEAESDNKKERFLFLANAYALKLLVSLGYQPEIYRCVSCQQGIVLPKNNFHLLSGGLVCEKCKKICLLEQYLKISDGTIKIFRLVLEQDLAGLAGLKNNLEYIEEFNRLLKNILLINLERPINSENFFQYV